MNPRARNCGGPTRYVTGGVVPKKKLSTVAEAKRQGLKFDLSSLLKSNEERNEAAFKKTKAAADKAVPRTRIYSAKSESAAEKAKAAKSMKEGSENEANAMKRFKKGGSVRGNGCAVKGKTRGKMR